MANTLLEPTSALPDLTSERSQFIFDAQESGEIYVEQPYELYSEANHHSWRELYAGMQERWQRHANEHFLRGLDPAPAQPGPGAALGRRQSVLIPADAVLDTRRQRLHACFPVFRLPAEPAVSDDDHDPAMGATVSPLGPIFSMTSPAMCRCIPIRPLRMPSCASATAPTRRSSSSPACETKKRRPSGLTSIIQAMARFFWFTVETGLMREKSGVKVYGSALPQLAR